MIWNKNAELVAVKSMVENMFNHSTSALTKNQRPIPIITCYVHLHKTTTHSVYIAYRMLLFVFWTQVKTDLRRCLPQLVSSCNLHSLFIDYIHVCFEMISVLEMVNCEAKLSWNFWLIEAFLRKKVNKESKRQVIKRHTNTYTGLLITNQFIVVFQIPFCL